LAGDESPSDRVETADKLVVLLTHLVVLAALCLSLAEAPQMLPARTQAQRLVRRCPQGRLHIGEWPRHCACLVADEVVSRREQEQADDQAESARLRWLKWRASAR
jgi:hypothetical protein